MDRPWSLYNKFEKLRIDDLRTDQVRTILLSIATRRIPDWYACRQGDINWQPLEEVPDFYEEVRELKGDRDPAKPLIKAKERRPMFEDFGGAEGASNITIENEPSMERRSARRYERQLTFRAFAGGVPFVAKTLDISMSGFSLESPLPTQLANKFEADLELNGKILRVTCEKVGPSKVRIINANSWDLLRQWLVNW